MAVTSLDDWFAAKKQTLSYIKTATRTSVAYQKTSLIDLAGNPGAGTLAGTSTASGVVPTDATAGMIAIDAFDGGAKGYLGRVLAFSPVLGTIFLYDLLFKAGAYSYNANVNLTSQPAISGRCPDYSGGATFGKGCQILYEQVTTATGNQAVTIGYTNSDGTGSRSTGSFSTGAAFAVGRCIIVPLQAGDFGVQKIDSVVGATASAGTFNILIVRPLAVLRIQVAAGTSWYDLVGSGMPEIYADSAIIPYFAPDSTSTSTPELLIDIISK